MPDRLAGLVVGGAKLVASKPTETAIDTRQSVRTAVIAWGVAAVYYFYQYVMRSAPSVMMPQLSEAFGVSTLGIASIVGLFYYGYSPFSLVAGAAMDRLGPRRVVPIGAVGQFGVGPLIANGVSWNSFWIGMGVAGLAIGAILFLLLPKEESTEKKSGGLKQSLDAFRCVFKNPQSILCGLIAGLIFIPTTIFDMIWGVRYLQEAHGLDYADAVMRSASVPL